jgi:hypothetical protein
MRALLLLLAGCHGSAATADLSLAPDLAPLHITAGATDGTVKLLNADFSIGGTGSTRIGAFNIAHGSGTIELDKKSVPAAVYVRQMFSAEHLFLYQTLAVETDRLWVLWFYCSSIDNSLQGIYYEATDGTPVTLEDATGTCQDLATTSTVAVQYPAIDLPLPTLVPGFTIDGVQVKLDGAAPGTLTLDSGALTVLVFNTVDCRNTCGTPGWTELHSLLWDQERSRVCFGIFYLEAGDPSHVLLTYSLTLPSLTDPAGQLTLPATWTTP